MKTIYNTNRDIDKNIHVINRLAQELFSYYQERDYDMSLETIADIEAQLIQLKSDINWIKNRV